VSDYAEFRVSESARGAAQNCDSLSIWKVPRYSELLYFYEYGSAFLKNFIIGNELNVLHCFDLLGQLSVDVRVKADNCTEMIDVSILLHVNDKR
jgi:hypothetical protein